MEVSFSLLQTLENQLYTAYQERKFLGLLLPKKMPSIEVTVLDASACYNVEKNCIQLDYLSFVDTSKDFGEKLIGLSTTVFPFFSGNLEEAVVNHPLSIVDQVKEKVTASGRYYCKTLVESSFSSNLQRFISTLGCANDSSYESIKHELAHAALEKTIIGREILKSNWTAFYLYELDGTLNQFLSTDNDEKIPDAKKLFSLMLPYRQRMPKQRNNQLLTLTSMYRNALLHRRKQLNKTLMSAHSMDEFVNVIARF